MTTLPRIVCTLLISLPIVCWGQQTTLAKFIVTEARLNGIDVSATYVNSGSYIAFYQTEGDCRLQMANIMSNRNTQSFGVLAKVAPISTSTTAEGYRKDVFDFVWTWQNSYDSRSGSSMVELTKVYKPQGVAFTCTIMQSSLDLLLYRGYMEGTLDFSKY